MGNLSKFDIGIIVAFVLILFGGIGGWWYTSGWVTSAKSEIRSKHRKLKDLNKERFTPSQANINLLKEKTEKLSEAIQPILLNKLAPADSPLKDIKAMNPVSWKTDRLLVTVRRLQDEAKGKSITLPENFYFSFSRYQAQDPTETATLVLGKQLYGIESLVDLLYASGVPPAVRSIDGIRRTFDENPPINPKSMIQGSAGQKDPEGLLLNVTEVDELYRVYPFEIAFTGTTKGLRKFLDALAAAPTVFVVRAVNVDNSKPIAPTRTEVAAMVNKGSTGLNSSPYDETDSSNLAPAVGPQPVFGSEELSVRVRVDMIEWIAGKEDAEEATAGASEAKEGERS